MKNPFTMKSGPSNAANAGLGIRISLVFATANHSLGITATFASTPAIAELSVSTTSAHQIFGRALAPMALVPRILPEPRL